MDVIKSAFAANLNALLDRAEFPPSGQGRVRTLAARLAISRASAQNWLKGTSIPETSRLFELCDVLRCSLNDLFAGSPCCASATSNPHLSELRLFGDPSAKVLHVDQGLAASFGPNVRLSALKVTDAMMEPFVTAGEYVFFQDTEPGEPLRGVYVLMLGGAPVVRRLQQTVSADPNVRVLCENKRYSAEEIPLCELQYGNTLDDSCGSLRPTIIGRVVARFLLRC